MTDDFDLPELLDTDMTCTVPLSVIIHDIPRFLQGAPAARDDETDEAFDHRVNEVVIAHLKAGRVPADHGFEIL